MFATIVPPTSISVSIKLIPSEFHTPMNLAEMDMVGSAPTILDKCKVYTKGELFVFMDAFESFVSNIIYYIVHVLVRLTLPHRHIQAHLAYLCEILGTLVFVNFPR